MAPVRNWDDFDDDQEFLIPMRHFWKEENAGKVLKESPTGLLLTDAMKEKARLGTKRHWADVRAGKIQRKKSEQWASRDIRLWWSVVSKQRMKRYWAAVRAGRIQRKKYVPKPETILKAAISNRKTQGTPEARQRARKNSVRYWADVRAGKLPSRKLSPEGRLGMSVGGKKREANPEFKQWRRERMQQYWADVRAGTIQRKKYVPSAETRLKISATLKKRSQMKDRSSVNQ